MASKGVEVPTGVTLKKVEFILPRGTPREHRVSMLVTVVDTTMYDALLGMELLLQWGGIMIPTLRCLGRGG